MSFDFTGINNVNEFYSNHYLNAIFAGDLKSLFQKWEKERAPYLEVGALSNRYLQNKNLHEREELAEEQFYYDLGQALGYRLKKQIRELENNEAITIEGELTENNGSPYLWFLQAHTEKEESPLKVKPSADSLFSKSSFTLPEENWESIISKKIFPLEESPRWLILLSLPQIILLDRSKWGEKRYLSFDLDEILGRKESSTIKAFTALLHKESIAPDKGSSFLDTLDENSHKHAFSVSKDLKYGVRRAVELIANEYVHYNRETLHQKMYESNLAQQLTQESLRYLYRLLFIFYIEARPELDMAPTKSKGYLQGYSLESLRDLELIPLSTEREKNGHYIHESLKMLFHLFFEGLENDPEGKQMTMDFQPTGKTDLYVFSLPSLKSNLFNPTKTPLLNKVKFRNQVLQEVIGLLSLSQVNKGKSRGRISYAQLGINQLGHIYEGLLSYSGFFAEEDLYEVCAAGQKSEENLEQAFFVRQEEWKNYKESERVHEPDGQARCYPRGTFIYRLAGRNREKTASFYTPESLTQCVVRFALQEALKDKTADEILQLSVCEPALGSGSFLNEALNQMADIYLQRKQKELSEHLDFENYAQEKQKVKSYLASHNFYGVDLNETALELAEISLWLNSLHQGQNIPWLRMRFLHGNSLIGARRECFSSGQVTGKKNKKWQEKVPRRVPLGEARKPEEIYHFLLPDLGMSEHKDKVIRGLVPEELQTMQEWRKNFLVPLREEEAEQLLKMSAIIDELWQEHSQTRAQLREKTNDSVNIYGQEENSSKKAFSMQQKDDFLKRIEFPFSPYRRLQFVMDYWCALWFWPIEKASLLPSRDEYLLELQLLLFGSEVQSEKDYFFSKYGYADVDELCEKIERFALVRSLKKKHNFFHWELEFADLFFERGGFDLILGNPPWVKVEWNEKGLLGEYDASLLLHKISSSEVAKRREKYLEQKGIKEDYLEEYVEFSGIKSFLNAKQNYPELKGIQTNLYKCFITQSWKLGSKKGVTGFLHPEGVYDDGKGKIFRQEIYLRIKWHFQFVNELRLFEEVDHHAKYSINIYGVKKKDNISEHIFNLFSPLTIGDCFQHNGVGEIPGIKDEDFNWNLEGHQSRVIEINHEVLQYFKEIFEDEKTPILHSRLLALHSREVFSVIRKLTKQKRKLGDLKDQYFATAMFDETYAQRDGYIEKNICRPDSLEQVVISGPHYFVGTPFNKEPRESCKNNLDYDDVDLTKIADDYIPRVMFIPTKQFLKEEKKSIPENSKLGMVGGKKITDFYRYQNRIFVGPTNERTLISGMYPPLFLHHNGSISITFLEKNYEYLLNLLGISFSIVADFLVKLTGKTHVLTEILAKLPLPEIESTPLGSWMFLRTLCLNCLTTHYQEVWDQMYQSRFTSDSFTKNDPRLHDFSEISPTWTRSCALRSPYERRQALVELDALTAIALDLTLEELLIIYKVQFPVLQKYEHQNHYDRNGLLVPREVLKQAAKQNIKIKEEGHCIEYQAPKMYPHKKRRYETPYDRCERKDDLRLAYETFQKRLLALKES